MPLHCAVNSGDLKVGSFEDKWENNLVLYANSKGPAQPAHVIVQIPHVIVSTTCDYPDILQW